MQAQASLFLKRLLTDNLLLSPSLLLHQSQAYCAAHSTHSKLFVPLLKKFYNDDIVSDDSILSWWKSPISRDASAANGGEAMLELRKSAEGVVRHVLESQEDSEEEEEESD